MQQWEYRIIRALYSGNYLYPAYIDGEEVRDPSVRGKSMYEYINRLGKVGWELVAVAQDGERFVFKRAAVPGEGGAG